MDAATPGERQVDAQRPSPLTTETPVARDAVPLRGFGNQAVVSALSAGRGLARSGGRCACGGVAGPDGECEECRRKRLARETGQERPALARAPTPTGERCPCGGVAGPDGLCDECRAKTKGVLVDEATPARPGAMTRDAFMAELRTRLTAVCNAELSAVGRSADDCPYLQNWLGHYEQKPAATLEATISEYAGVRADDAASLLGGVVSRVRGAVRVWATTGEVTGIPTELGDAAAPGGGEAAEAPAPAAAAPEAAVARTPLRQGAPLEAPTRRRMERGFGRSFADVRIHADAEGSALARSLGAHAVTLGRDVAFAAGEYRPGTLAGDAMIAHELAHTVQQADGRPALARELELDRDGALEDEADAAALAALSGAGTARLSEGRGLRFQGCSHKTKACPKGKQWYPTATMQWGSLGCTCIWKCLKDAPGASSGSSGPAYTCPPRVNCSDPYDRVDEDYSKTGYGAAFTPLGAEPWCGCFPLDIEGGEQASAPPVPVTIDMTNIVGPGADMAAGAKARKGGRPSSPQTDPRTGTRIPGQTPRPAAVQNPLRERVVRSGLYSSGNREKMDRIFDEADPAVMTALERTLELPHDQRAPRVEKLLEWAETRPTPSGRVEEGATFGKGGTGSVAEVVGRPDLASKKGAGRAGSEAAAMVELELAGIPTVYVAEGLNQKGEARLILKRIDGYGSKDIIGRPGKPPENAELAAKGREAVTQKTIDDLHAIREKLKEAKLNVGDFQFILRKSDGAVFLNDPTGVTPNSKPSGDIDNIISRFEKIVRDRARGMTSSE